MLADKAQVKGLKVSEMVGMEQYGKGDDFTVRYMGKCGYGAACQIVKVYFFQLRSTIFVKIVESTEYSY